MEEMRKIMALNHQNILRYKNQYLKEETNELLVITELITAGSLREYLKRVKLPLLKVVKSWCQKILSGLHYLHTQGLAHCRLTCESIYINSNNGDIKIGDLGIKVIKNYDQKFSEIVCSDILRA